MTISISLLAEEFGISVWLLAVILIWSLAWKLVALWKSARAGSRVWFITLALLNTVGILEILYIYVFSKMRLKKAKTKPKKKVKRKKK